MAAETVRPARGGALLALLACACTIGLLLLRTKDAGSRLYWEYAGRLLHRPVTSGYIEWVQHRIGDPPAIEKTVLLSASVAPYSGFSAEYPPGALLLFAGIRALGDNLVGFDFCFMLLMAGLGFVMTLAAWRLRARLLPDGTAEPKAMLIAALAFTALWPVLIGPFAVTRFDVVPAALAIGGLLMAVQGRAPWGGALLGLGAAVKLWPGLLLPLLIASLWFSGRRRSAIATAIAGASGFALPHLAMIALGTAPSDVLAYLGYLGARPAQVESLVGNLMTVWAYLTGMPVHAAFDFGSHNVEVAGSGGWIMGSSLLNGALLVLLFACVCVRTRRAGSDRERAHILVAACATAVGVTMLCSRVFSGEYLIWLIPFGIALSVSRLALAGLGLLSLTLMALKVTYRVYDLVTAATLEGTLVSLAKNLLLLAAVLAFAVPLLRPSNTAPAEP